MVERSFRLELRKVDANNFDEANRKLEAEELMLSQITKQLDRLQEDTEQMQNIKRVLLI